MHSRCIYLQYLLWPLSLEMTLWLRHLAHLGTLCLLDDPPLSAPAAGSLLPAGGDISSSTGGFPFILPPGGLLIPWPPGGELAILPSVGVIKWSLEFTIAESGDQSRVVHFTSDLKC